ncbi:MAG TPA: HD domain-containing protein [Candidatus Bathyarchaeota archaeon]|nr:HD domain-containing protein [Candidatus Bathyarchaeota archaeon]
MSAPQGPYAFHRPGERVERLEDHIINGLQAIQTYYLAEGYHHFMVFRLKALGIDVRPVEVEGALMLAYAYHDIAKAAEPYQSVIVEGHGAPGHELVSAYVARITLEEGVLRLPEPLGWACVKAIALHMGAMRELPERTIRTSIRRILRQARCNAFTMSESTTSWFNDLLKRCWHIGGLPPPTLPDHEITISLEALSFFVAQELSPRLKGSDRYKAEDLATLLLLHPVVLADELAVAINIGRKPRRWAKGFTDSVEEARKYRRGVP